MNGTKYFRLKKKKFVLETFVLDPQTYEREG